MIQGHGDDIYSYPDIRSNFSSNVNPGGVDNALKEHLGCCMDLIGSYPQPLAEDLACVIEQREELPHGSVLVTNGAVEAFYLTARLFYGKRSLVYIPSFSEYADACKKAAHDIEYRHHSLFCNDHLGEFDLVWICNPNNPDGKIYDYREVMKKVQCYPNTLFVVDEAYIDFLIDSVSLQNYTEQFPNLVIVRSLTKKFVIPGLRLGYLIASSELVGELHKLLMPWRINALAIEAGMFCLKREQGLSFDPKQYLAESRQMQEAIDNLEGFEVLKSDTIFFTVKGPVKASVLKEILAREHGILIRDAGNFMGLTPNHFRLSVQSPDENNQLIEILAQWK